MTWLSHPHAFYVLTAYLIALGALLGLLVFSVIHHRRAARTLRTLGAKNQ